MGVFSHDTALALHELSDALPARAHLTLPASWRREVGIFMFIFAATISFNRVAFGGHYFSDVVISAALTLTIALGLHVFFYGKRAPALLDEKLIDSRFDAFGDFVLRRR